MRYASEKSCTHKKKKKNQQVYLIVCGGLEMSNTKHTTQLILSQLTIVFHVSVTKSAARLARVLTTRMRNRDCPMLNTVNLLIVNTPCPRYLLSGSLQIY